MGSDGLRSVEMNALRMPRMLHEPASQDKIMIRWIWPVLLLRHIQPVGKASPSRAAKEPRGAEGPTAWIRRWRRW